MSIDTNNHESSRQAAKTPRRMAFLGAFASWRELIFRTAASSTGASAAMVLLLQRTALTQQISE